MDLWGFKSQCSTCAVKELCFAVKRTAFLERKTASTVWRHCMLSKKLVLRSKGQHSSKERQHRLCGGTVCCQRSLFCGQKDSIPRKKDSINRIALSPHKSQLADFLHKKARMTFNAPWLSPFSFILRQNISLQGSCLRPCIIRLR